MAPVTQSIFEPKPTNGRYLVVDVTVRGDSGKTHFNPLDWRLQTADDRIWTATIPVKTPSFDDGDVMTGRAVRGYITTTRASAS